MSIRLFALAFDFEDVTSSEKLVLLALCDRAAEDNTCWPSYADIQRRTQLNLKTIGKCLASLEAKGLIAKRKRFSNSTVYSISENRLRSNVSNIVEEMPVPRLVHKNNKKETQFEEFWSMYPNKKAKSPAKAKFLRLTADQIDAALADVRKRPQGDPDWVKENGKFVPMAQTYINQERWEDVWSPQIGSSMDVGDFF